MRQVTREGEKGRTVVLLVYWDVGGLVPAFYLSVFLVNGPRARFCVF